MNNMPRLRAGTALTLACLLIATPLFAQQADGESAAPATSTVEAPAAPAAQPGGETSATAPVATPQTSTAASPATTTEAAPQPAAAPTAGTEPASTPPAETPMATGIEPTAQPDAAGTASQSTTAETSTVTPPAPATSTPTAQPTAAEPVDIPGVDLLPQSVQDALTPMLQPRDPNLPHDLSPMGMFLAADWVVKAVMIGLAIASVITWTVLVVKVLELAGASNRAQSGIRRIEAAGSLSAAVAASGRRGDTVSRMVRAAAGEYERSAAALDEAGDAGVKERVDSHLDRITAIAGRRMGRGTGLLATIGSTAPFVGLFGTVWGIMNSFIGISEAQTTNLAIVAPGIAEALLATAIGLVAAIPAVVIYNVFARAITGYRMRLADAAAGVKRLVSRDLDFRGTRQMAGE